MDISSDDTMCVTVSKEQIKIWNIENMVNYQLKYSFSLENSCSQARFLPKDRFIIASDNIGNVYLFDIVKLEIIYSH